MLKKFAVNNYKCLVDVELPLTPIHVIIGQNDSGKTSLLEAMLAFSRTAEMSLFRAFQGEWKGRELVSETAKKPVLELRVAYSKSDDLTSSEFSYGLSVRFAHSDRDCDAFDEWFSNPNRISIPLPPLGNKGTSIRRAMHSDAFTEEQRNYLKEIVDFMGSASLYRLDPKTMSIPASLSPERKFRMDSDGFGLPTLIDDISGYDPDIYKKLREEFCEYFPQFRSIHTETEPALYRQLDQAGVMAKASMNTGKGIYFTTKHGVKIRAQQASDGALLFLGFLALVHTPNPPKLILIEEPEKGVYPQRLVEVIGLLRKLQESRPAGAFPQVIMTTHSTHLLSHFQPEEVTLMSRRGGTGPVRARPLRDAPFIHERLANGEFYLGELWYNLSEEELFGDA